MERQVEPMVMAILPPLKLRLQDSGQYYVHRHSIKMSTAVFIIGFSSGIIEISGPKALKMQLLKKASPAPPCMVSMLGLPPILYKENRGERPDMLQR